MDGSSGLAEDAGRVHRARECDSHSRLRKASVKGQGLLDAAGGRRLYWLDTASAMRVINERIQQLSVLLPVYDSANPPTR